MRKPIAYGEPININRTEKLSHKELFQKHLRQLTSYKQRVMYGIGDDIKEEHRSYAKPNLEGFFRKEIEEGLKEDDHLMGTGAKIDPFSTNGAFTLSLKAQEKSKNKK